MKTSVALALCLLAGPLALGVSGCTAANANGEGPGAQAGSSSDAATSDTDAGASSSDAASSPTGTGVAPGDSSTTGPGAGFDASGDSSASGLQDSPDADTGTTVTPNEDGGVVTLPDAAVADTSTTATCGDGACGDGETSQTCPQDCVLTCGSVVVDLSQGLMWEVAVSDRVTWPNANAYCGALTTGGYSDWILPAYADYETLLGNCASDPTTSGNLCSTCAASPACNAMFPGDQGTYWDSATYGTCCAGGTDFLTGGLQVGYEQNGSGTGGLLARCYREPTDCSTMPTCLSSEVCTNGMCVPATCP